MAAFLTVRAEVPEAERDAFDAWYDAEHLSERGWCADAPGIHIAIYRFSGPEQLEAALSSQAAAELIAEFDRVWGVRVTRRREAFSVCQRL